MTTTALRVIGYVRVSTNKQDIGPEVQIAALQAEADRNGWTLDLRRENAASAKTLKNRPVLAQTLADLKAGRADALAVSKLDRLSRSVADFSGLLETATRQRWALICLDLGIDTSTITGAAMAQVTCTFAEMERKKIAERTREGMAKIKATTGKHMGRTSTLPQATVDRIRRERAAGLSLAKIAATLNDEGVPTATGRTWHASTIRQVLSRWA
ncbi:recombinase family protein [Kocuria marina]|uniref:recombinase family protein n=1 Tax=Kocuria marina TaxID=223184 RepID=UPI003460ED0A